MSGERYTVSAIMMRDSERALIATDVRDEERTYQLRQDLHQNPQGDTRKNWQDVRLGRCIFRAVPAKMTAAGSRVRCAPDIFPISPISTTIPELPCLEVTTDSFLSPDGGAEEQDSVSAADRKRDPRPMCFGR